MKWNSAVAAAGIAILLAACGDSGSSNDGVDERLSVFNVTRSNPVDGATDLDLRANLVVTFSDALNPTSITDGSVTLSSSLGSQAVMFDVSGDQLTVRPNNRLEPMTAYTLTISSGLRASRSTRTALDSRSGLKPMAHASGSLRIDTCPEMGGVPRR